MAAPSVASAPGSAMWVATFSPLNRSMTAQKGDLERRRITIFMMSYYGAGEHSLVWQTNRIARISPQTGEVLGWIDLTGLLSPMYRLAEGEVLNGIAYDAAHKRLFVTGKLWPNLFEIQVVPQK